MTDSPRAYSQHQRYRKFSRIKQGARQFSAFLAAEGTKLTQTSAQVFAKLTKNTAQRIKNAATTGDLA